MQAIFFDIQKAFDTVPHVKLITKLSSPSHLVAWISSYLFSRQQQVAVSGVAASFVDVNIRCTSRVSIRASMIYIDGLAELSLHSSKLQLFADCALMYRIVQNSSDAKDLQADINLFVQWIANNNLKLNIKNVNHFYCLTGIYQNVTIHL